MSEKMKNIPKLRFPEFQNAPEWENRRLNEFITERIEYSADEVQLYSLTIEDGVTPKTERYERSFLVNDEENAYKIVFPNDFAYNPMNLRFGAIARHSGSDKVALSRYYNIFYCNESVVSRFCEIYFKSHNMIQYYDKMSTGSLIEKRRVHFKDFLEFKILFPSKQEQQKIADCLSSLDELITAQAEKVEALKTHKKALMQHLFPREGESIPRLRFPEFQNAPEWEEKPLGDVFNFLRGSLFSKADIVENGTSKCIHYGELFTVYKEKIFEIKSSTNLENGQFSQNGDILMPSSDVTPEGLATASAIFEAGVIIGGDVNILRPKNQVSSLFISYLLNFSKKDIMKLVTGTTVKHIYNKDIAKLDIKIPLQPKEQQKIADCLSSLDELITAQAEKVEALRTHKKALMQQLFPSNDKAGA